MIQPLIKFISISDIELEKRADSTEFNNVNCTFDVDISFDRNDIGADTFSIQVITIYALSKIIDKEEFHTGECTLIVKKFVKRDIYKKIHALVDECQAETYEGAVIKLMNYFSYEYEDDFISNI